MSTGHLLCLAADTRNKGDTSTHWAAKQSSHGNILITVLGYTLCSGIQDQSLEDIEELFTQPWSKRANIFYYLK